MRGNESLTVYTCTLLDHIKDSLEKDFFKFKFDSLLDSISPESPTDAGVDIVVANADVDMVADIPECAVDTSIAGPIIFGACSVKRYKKIRVCHGPQLSCALYPT